MLQKREGKKYITIPAIPGKTKETQEIYGYKSMPLIAIESNKEHEIANADEFRVISFTATQVKVGAVLDDGSIDDDKIIEIPVDIFPKLLQPANDAPHSSLGGMTPKEAWEFPSKARDYHYERIQKGLMKRSKLKQVQLVKVTGYEF